MKIRSIALEQPYLPGCPVLPLAAACELSAEGVIARACITDQVEQLQQLVQAGGTLEQLAAQLGIAILDFQQPWRLQPVHIPKPWGQEIWYTGIEARGVSQVVSATGVTPLSWAIALDHTRVLGAHSQPNLLKILEPLPDEVYGDLYFELHETKREVYIVTHVDENAWPDGAGAIRYGFSPDKRAQFASDADFVTAYRDAVREYHAVRRELDAALDACRIREGVGLHEPVAASLTQRWLAEMPQDVRSREATLRAQMDNFTAMRRLRVGDVLAVPLRTPHALQHGVRTVEFQTPVYERKILSFAQKVLTQDHWDTEEALQLASLHTSDDEAFPVLCDEAGIRIEQIVAFEDFTVQRIQLQPGAKLSRPASGDYALIMVVSGRLCCGTEILAPEQAVLVPASAQTVMLHNETAQLAVLLLAQPA